MRTPPARIVSIICLTASLAIGQVKVEEQVVGPASQRENYQYAKSESGLRLAGVAMKGSRFVAIVDGVEGPPFEEIYQTAIKWQHLPDIHGELTQHAVQGASPVALSADGSRFAYAARDKQDVVVICDGKEIFRAPFSPSQPRVALLQFSPGGKHVYFMTPTTDTMYSVCLVMDGEAGPGLAKEAWPVFSADEQHWAYYGTKPTPQAEGFVVVDGKVADWVGGRLRYLPDGRLLAVHHDPQGNQKGQLLVDGKELMSADEIRRVAVSATGDIGAIARNGSDVQLYINGKPMPETDHAASFVFSPDGKRHAVRAGGGSPPQSWQAIDGKKGQTYGGVSEAVFSADSSKVMYTAEVQNKKFVITDGQESEGFDYILTPPFAAPAGSKLACVAGGPSARRAIVDGKIFDPAQKCEGFAFSPDGARYGFLQSIDLGTDALILDGKKMDGFVRGGALVFSADSKHYAILVIPPGGRGNAVLIDDQLIPYPAGLTAMQLVGFTPDSRHLVWTGAQQDGKAVVGVNGAIVGTFDRLWVAGLRQGMTEIAPDGTILALGTVAEQAKRLKITPDSQTGIDTWAADVKAAQEKAIADAAQKAADEKAAKEKAAADAKAAQEKAAADRKAALEKKAADRKAALEKAAADKKAAQEKAAAEKAAKQNKNVPN